MADSKTKTGRLGEWLILILVIVCVLLIVAEVGVNVLAELESRGDSTTGTEGTAGMALLISPGQTREMEASNSVEMGGGTS